MKGEQGRAPGHAGGDQDEAGEFRQTAAHEGAGALGEQMNETGGLL